MPAKVKSELIKLGLSILGMSILAITINLLSWQFQLISGGLPGYGLSLNYTTGISVGTFLLVANTVILGLSFLIAGKTAGVRGVFGYTFLSLFIDLSRQWLDIPQTELASFWTNAGLIALQGLIAPIGISLVLVSEYSFGSYSSILPIVQKFIKISPPIVFFIFDGILTILTLTFFGWEKALLLLINASVFFVSFKYSLKLSSSLKNKPRTTPAASHSSSEAKQS